MKLIIEDAFYETLEIYDTVTVMEMADFDVGLRQMLEAEQSTTTIATDNVTLVDGDNVIQLIDPGGADRIVTLPAESINNHGYLIINIGDAGEMLTVKDNSLVIIGYVGQGGMGWFISNGLAWYAAYDGSVTANPVCEGRLSLESGISVSTSDQADKQTVYYTLHNGNRISLYNGSAWVEHTFTERSLDVSSFTADKNYDIFLHDAGGILTLTGLVWADDTTRATAVVKLGGILVKSGANTYRYLGTIRMDTSQYVQDTVLFRGVWNQYNQKQRNFIIRDATTSWVYSTATWRQMRATTANKVEFVVGISESPIRIRSAVAVLIDGGTTVYTGVGLDSITAVATDSMIGKRGKNDTGNSTVTVLALYNGYPGIGYHYLAPLEKGIMTCYGAWHQLFEGAILG